MKGEKASELGKLDADNVNELDDEALDDIAGGYVYHDAGDPSAHRREAFYVVDDSGDIVMRLDDLGAAKHWAGNLRTSQKVITADEYERIRKTGKPL